MGAVEVALVQQRPPPTPTPTPPTATTTITTTAATAEATTATTLATTTTETTVPVANGLREEGNADATAATGSSSDGLEHPPQSRPQQQPQEEDAKKATSDDGDGGEEAPSVRVPRPAATPAGHDDRGDGSMGLKTTTVPATATPAEAPAADDTEAIPRAMRASAGDATAEEPAPPTAPVASTVDATERPSANELNHEDSESDVEIIAVPEDDDVNNDDPGNTTSSATPSNSDKNDAEGAIVEEPAAPGTEARRTNGPTPTTRAEGPSPAETAHAHAPATATATAEKDDGDATPSTTDPPTASTTTATLTKTTTPTTALGTAPATTNTPEPAPTTPEDTAPGSEVIPQVPIERAYSASTSDVVDSDAGVVVVEDDEDEDEASAAATAQNGRRRKKRSRRLGFTSLRRTALVKQRRQSALTVAAAAAADKKKAEASRTKAAIGLDDNDGERGGSGAEGATDDQAQGVGLYPTPAPGIEVHAWEWESCQVYFDPLTQRNVDDLARLRRECASLVASNRHVCRRLTILGDDDAGLGAILADATTDQLFPVRPTRRGRYYRDVWEEEDFLIRERRLSTRSGKKRPFAGCQAVADNRELVRGYDDEAFHNYLVHLEQQQQQQHSHAALPEHPGVKAPNEDGETIDPPRGKSRPSTRCKLLIDHETLPPIRTTELHPAACGAWKLKHRELPAFDRCHPAALGRHRATSRGSEEWAKQQPQQATSEAENGDATRRRSLRHESNKPGGPEVPIDVDAEDTMAQFKPPSAAHIGDGVEPLPSFGTVVDEDEISQTLAASLTSLVALSTLNWRQVQTLTARAMCHLETATLLDAEAAVRDRLERLYRELFPASGASEDDEPVPRPGQLVSKPKDLIAYGTDGCVGPLEEVAVAASIEYGLRLKTGDEVDVLDRNGCWNDGVVLELGVEGGKVVKYVLVSFATWGEDMVEWVATVDGRLLPRGVADGRVTFVLAPTRVRKRRLELNQEIADALERTYPARRLRRVSRGGGAVGPTPQPSPSGTSHQAKRPPAPTPESKKASKKQRSRR